MKEVFDDFYKMLKLDRQKSFFSKSHNFEDRFLELKKEIDELETALKNKDFKNFEEEIGDCLWDILFLIVIAEEKNLFTAKKVIQNSIDKLKRRKGWLFEGKEMASLEEELRVWNENKRKEKGL
jgi:NTP pyrophosphatase (non-canonical NTP hydrolase)